MKVRLQEKELDSLILSKPENIRYLTGYTGDTGVYVLHGEKEYLLTDFRYEEQAKMQAVNCEIVTVQGSYTDVIAQLVGKTVGFEGSVLRWTEGEELRKKCGEMKDVSGWIEDLRTVKTKQEQELIQKASHISQEAFWQTLQVIRPGMAEREVAAELDYRMRRLGAERTSFTTITVAGANSSLVHGEPGEYRLRSGDFLLMDFGCVYEGYCSDMTRTVGIGQVSQKQKEIYRIVKEAQSQALSMIKPGVPFKEADRAARQVIDEAGFGNRFGHSLGHGVGLEIHEKPTLSPKSEGVLSPGMVVTVEPGIYLEGEFGVRIEDLVIVNDVNCDNLCQNTPKELLCV